jgi:hypothetical protein
MLEIFICVLLLLLLVRIHLFIHVCLLTFFMLNPLDPQNRAASGCGQVAGTCECGNEPSGSIKCGRILTS